MAGEGQCQRRARGQRCFRTSVEGGFWGFIGVYRGRHRIAGSRGVKGFKRSRGAEIFRVLRAFRVFRVLGVFRVFRVPGVFKVWRVEGVFRVLKHPCMTNARTKSVADASERVDACTICQRGGSWLRLVISSSHDRVSSARLPELPAP